MNELKSRTDVAVLLLDMVRPLKELYSEGHAWLHVGDTGAHYGEKAARMESFSRILWGLGPLFAREVPGFSAAYREEVRQWKEICLDGLIHGTDPSYPEYWGTVVDYDQKMVEMAALATAVMLAPEALWTPLNSRQKENLYTWLNQINGKGVHPNNWRFFRILVNVMFRVLGLAWNRTRMEEDLAVIESCYDGDGWYFDGNRGQVDYYIPFAMHYYGLLYARFEEEEEPEYCRTLKERAKRFAEDFIYWFSGDGSEIPYGRSLTYRFAHGACFSAMALAGLEDVDYGVFKGLALGNLRRWMEKPIFDKKGILTIGYGYPNLFMSEKYNAPGSPYWSFKTFLMLALPEEHPFWQAEEKEFPYGKKKLLSHPHMLVTHDRHHHVLAYPAGQHSMDHGCCAEKYEKFVYSNQFGFSVSRGTALDAGAFDCALAVSESGENCYRIRYGIDDFSVEEDQVWTSYHVMRGVKVDTTIVPLGAWHVRIHEIETERSIDLADGGFSIQAERCFSVIEGAESGKYRPDMVRMENGKAFASFPWGISGVVSMDGGEADMLTLFPNTNLFYNLTVMPTVKKTLQPGSHVVITCVFGDMSGDRDTLAEQMPEVTDSGDTYTVRLGEETVFVRKSRSGGMH